MRFTLRAVQKHIMKHHPRCPDRLAAVIAAQVAQRSWLDVTIGGAVGITMQNHVRHRLTHYERLYVEEGLTQKQARARIQPLVNEIIRQWSSVGGCK